MSTIDKFPIPGVSQPGQAGDAAPDSLLAELRGRAAQKRRKAETALVIPGDRWAGSLRIRYGTMELDELDRWRTSGIDMDDATLAASLEIIARAVRSVEGRSSATGDWRVLEDNLGPVKVDDRLARLLQWERPGEDFTYSVREVYDRLFDGNGFAITQHVASIAQFMGLVEEDIASSEPSTDGGLTRSAPPSSSE